MPSITLICLLLAFIRPCLSVTDYPEEAVPIDEQGDLPDDDWDDPYGPSVEDLIWNERANMAVGDPIRRPRKICCDKIREEAISLGIKTWMASPLTILLLLSI